MITAKSLYRQAWRVQRAYRRVLKMELEYSEKQYLVHYLAQEFNDFPYPIRRAIYRTLLECITGNQPILRFIDRYRE